LSRTRFAVEGNNLMGVCCW